MTANYNKGAVNAKGESSLPDGIQDSTAGADLIEMDPQAVAELEKLMASMLGGELKANYKIEVIFGDDRSISKPFGGMVSIWTNGGFMHGGGDEAVYLCANEIEPSKFCAEPIRLAFISKTFAICPRCKTVVDPKELAGQIYYKLTVQGWVEVLVRAFKRLECSADIRIGHFQGDIRRATLEEQTKDHRGEKIHKVYNAQKFATYPLRNIVKDTSSSSSTLQSRVRAFLLS